MDKTLREIILCGAKKRDENSGRRKKKIKGTVVLMKKNVLDFKDYKASFLDRMYELFGKHVSIQLISASNGDPSNDMKGMLSKPATLENWGTKMNCGVTVGDSQFDVWFEWDESMGDPGAFLIKNHHHSQFYLKSLTLENVPRLGRVHFACNSWVYPTHCYRWYDRIFFSNKTYLPSQTPEPLVQYRLEELRYLRGDGSSRMLKEWDRVYAYAFYDDLAIPEKGSEFERPVLGGSEEYPYPRRGRTNRPRNKRDPDAESRLALRKSLNIYVPRDEQFSHIKLTDFIAYAVKSIPQMMVPEIKSLFDKTPDEFESFEDVMKMYEDVGPGHRWTRNNLRECIKWEMLRELLRSDAGKFLKFPTPDVIKEDKSSWKTDEEFGREMLAGVNPVLIRRLQEFPPASKLDPRVYGNQTSSITREQIENNMNGLTVDEAIENNKLFILNHHDALMPFLRRINSTKSKVYASRTVLLLQEDGTLKPLVIELSLPHPQGDENGAISSVFTPAENGIQGSIWQLAKAYAVVNDSGYHQLISHWLNTHAVIEPFVIASHRQLSVVHPIYKLLQPHFRDTMKINALARQILLNAGGVLEMTVFPGKFSMEMSSSIYKDWVFTDQALPTDLLKRGVAVQDFTAPHGLRLLIEDYPYAVDGLEIWFAIESWVREYCSIYYSTDATVENDSELKSWWDEIRLVGHGDLQYEPWWPIIKTQDSLIQVCTIIIWIASALHAAVNFGQYTYAGYLPNRPTISRQLMPEPGSQEYGQLESNPEKVFLNTITGQFQMLLGVSLIETLSRHSSDEVYLGQREGTEWTSDGAARQVFARFGVRLMEIQTRILNRNSDERLKNRNGPVKVPYMLLYPNTLDYSRDGGLTGKGIPNSVSI